MRNLPFLVVVLCTVTVFAESPTEQAARLSRGIAESTAKMNAKNAARRNASMAATRARAARARAALYAGVDAALLSSIYEDLVGVEAFDKDGRRTMLKTATRYGRKNRNAKDVIVKLIKEELTVRDVLRERHNLVPASQDHGRTLQDRIARLNDADLKHLLSAARAMDNATRTYGPRVKEFVQSHTLSAEGLPRQYLDLTTAKVGDYGRPGVFFSVFDRIDEGNVIADYKDTMYWVECDNLLERTLYGEQVAAWPRIEVVGTKTYDATTVKSKSSESILTGSRTTVFKVERGITVPHLRVTSKLASDARIVEDWTYTEAVQALAARGVPLPN